jgi:predicted dehydrogenase
MRDLRNTAILSGERGLIEVKLARQSWIRTEPPELLARPVNGIRVASGERQREVDLFKHQIMAWVDAIRGRGRPLAPASEVAPSIALIEACHRNRQPLLLPWLSPDGDVL